VWSHAGFISFYSASQLIGIHFIKQHAVIAQVITAFLSAKQKKTFNTLTNIDSSTTPENHEPFEK
jgi:hypothetical protein